MPKVLRIVLPLLAVAAAAAFWFFRLRPSESAKTDIGRLVTVKTGDVILKVSENGTLEPVRRVDVKSRVAGRLRRILVREGDTVVSGQTLALVDPIEIERDVAGVRARLAASRASLGQAQENYELTRKQNALAIERAQATLNETKARYRQAAAPSRTQDIMQAKESLVRSQQNLARAKQSVTRAEQSVARAQAQLTVAELTLQRRKALVAKGFLAQAELDTADTQVAVARADLQAAVSDVQAAQSDVRGASADEKSAQQRLSLLKEGPRVEDIATAKAALRTAEIALQAERANAAQAGLRLRDIERTRAEISQIENQLAQQMVQLSETKILAPIGGEVISKNIEEGELIASATAGFAQGATIVAIADLTQMQVRVNINEVDVARVKVGQPVEVQVDGVTGQFFVGKVSSIAPASISENNRAAGQSASPTGVVRFQVKISVVNTQRVLRPGMTAAVKIITDRRDKVTILAPEALQPSGKVTVITGTGKALTKTTKTVKVGLKSEIAAEIISGLEPGDKVEVPKLDAKDRRKIDLGPAADGP